MVGARKRFVPILYRVPAFGVFDDFDAFMESINYSTFKTCQECGSNPCRGANLLFNKLETNTHHFVRILYESDVDGSHNLLKRKTQMSGHGFGNCKSMLDRVTYSLKVLIKAASAPGC